MPRLTADNTNSRAHRLAGDTLVYECNRCETGEVVVTELIENRAASCSECGTRYELCVRRATHS